MHLANIKHHANMSVCIHDVGELMMMHLSTCKLVSPALFPTLLVEN